MPPQTPSFDCKKDFICAQGVLEAAADYMKAYEEVITQPQKTEAFAEHHALESLESKLADLRRTNPIGSTKEARAGMLKVAGYGKFTFAREEFALSKQEQDKFCGPNTLMITCHAVAERFQRAQRDLESLVKGSQATVNPRGK